MLRTQEIKKKTPQSGSLCRTNDNKEIKDSTTKLTLRYRISLLSQQAERYFAFLFNLSMQNKH